MSDRRKGMLWILAWAVVIAGTPALGQEAPAETRLEEALDRAVAAFLQENDVPGAAVGVLPWGRWLFGEVWGFGGLASTVPDLARFARLHLEAGAGVE